VSEDVLARIVVLDTNVVSELMRPTPAAAVLSWVEDLAPPKVHTTSVTLAEVRFGIARLPVGRRRATLMNAADDVFGAFTDRILPFDGQPAEHYADIVVECEQRGMPISGFDAQIAAICRTHRTVLATRNISDFELLGLDLVDPWAA
jgi:predicted nucleic acid-binding protein